MHPAKANPRAIQPAITGVVLATGFQTLPTPEHTSKPDICGQDKSEKKRTSMQEFNVKNDEDVCIIDILDIKKMKRVLNRLDRGAEY